MSDSYYDSMVHKSHIRNPESETIVYYFCVFVLFLYRVHFAGFNVTRPEGELGKYKSIPHHHRGEVQFLGRSVEVLPLMFLFHVSFSVICTYLPSNINDMNPANNCLVKQAKLLFVKSNGQAKEVSLSVYSPSTMQSFKIMFGLLSTFISFEATCSKLNRTKKKVETFLLDSYSASMLQD